jgi:hypothetical protein
MQEKWIRWEPAANLSTNYYTKSIIDTPEGFKVNLFDNSGKKILVSFPNSVFAYRSTDESFIYDTLDFLEKNYSKTFYTDWSFFKIENSEYLEWLKKQSGEMYEVYNLKHFCIFTINCMIDIANDSGPEIFHNE